MTKERKLLLLKVAFMILGASSLLLGHKYVSLIFWLFAFFTIFLGKNNKS
jgi:hypothetical protein